MLIVFTRQKAKKKGRTRVRIYPRQYTRFQCNVIYILFIGTEKPKGPVPINETEMAELINVQHLKEELQKGLDHLKADYVKNLSIRSTAG